MRMVAVIAAAGLTLGAAGCGDAPADEPSTGGSDNATKYGACMVTDVGGIDDRSFNAAAWAGLQAAAKEKNNVEPKNTASADEAAYEPNLTQYVQQKCNFVLSVGGLMIGATQKVAAANTGTQFAIVDGKVDGASNVYPMQFDTAQAAFLAGYLAAGYTKSGKVGTYGGIKLPTVTVFMDGFVDGVAHHNQVKGTKVQVLGWDKAKQNGTFAEGFTDQNKGKSISDTFVAQGADVILPVAGGAGLGTAAAAQASNGKFAVIWVDQDGCESAAQYCSAFLTTVVKNISDAVKQAVVKGAGGEPLAATPGFLGDLANNGVSLAPYHDFDSKVPAALKAEVDKLKQDIISGTVKVTSPSQPK
jgi:basic membrane protein A